MELLIIILATVALICYFFRIFISFIVMIIGCVTGGFFAGLGMGLVTYWVLSLVHWFLFTMGMANIYRRMYRSSTRKEN